MFLSKSSLKSRGRQSAAPRRVMLSAFQRERHGKGVVRPQFQDGVSHTHELVYPENWLLLP